MHRGARFAQGRRTAPGTTTTSGGTHVNVRVSGKEQVNEHASHGLFSPGGHHPPVSNEATCVIPLL